MLGAVGVWLGFPLADPIVGVLITVAIFGIVWQSARAVVTRMLDGVEPGVVEEIQHAAGHVAGVERVLDAKARWLGHDLHADVTIEVGRNLSLTDAQAIGAAVEAELRAHLPALRVANVRFGSAGADGALARPAPLHAPRPGSHHAPEPFKVTSDLAEGLLEIVDTRPASAETAAMPVWAEAAMGPASRSEVGSLPEGLLASGQSQMRKLDGWQSLATPITGQPVALAA